MRQWCQALVGLSAWETVSGLVKFLSGVNKQYVENEDFRVREEKAEAGGQYTYGRRVKDYGGAGR